MGEPKNNIGDKSFAALRSFYWKNKSIFLTIDLFRLIAIVATALHPYFIAQIVTSADDKNKAFTNLILLFVSGAFHYIAWNIADFLTSIKLVPRLYEIKKIAFQAVWKKKYQTFVERPSGKVGDYVNKFDEEAYALWDSYNYGFIPIISSVPVYIILLSNSIWQSSVIYTVFIIISSIIIITISKPLAKAQREYTDSRSSNSGKVFDSYSNFVNVFSFRSQTKEIRKINQEIKEVAADDKEASLYITYYWAAAAFMIRIILWPTILFYGWHLYDTGQVSFEAFVISIAVLIDFTTFFWEGVHHLSIWTKKSAIYKESYNYLFQNENIVKSYYQDKTDETKSKRISFDHELELKNISFAYPDAPEIYALRNLNLKISKNEKIGIVGKSGEGKTTLVKLLLGFYKPTEGQILVDGYEIDAEELSQLYSYVPQDTTLFQESVFYNIAYSKDSDTTLSEVEEAAEKAHIAEFIKQLPDQYNTMVGERGIKLSLGQRQRIAIARAFLKESDLLILDEATSALDSETENYVQKSFEKLWQNKSVIAIAHRLSTLNNVDRIIVMGGGQIVEQGTKDELLELDGKFADLWKHQRQGMI